MLLETKFFGPTEIEEGKILTLPEGVLGFEKEQRFAVLDMPKNSGFKCLQSMEEKNLAFLVINPWDFFPDYDITLQDEDVEALHIQEPSDVVVYNILTIGKEGKKVSANLLGPLVINSKTKEGKQIVLQNSPYHTKHELTKAQKGA